METKEKETRSKMSSKIIRKAGIRLTNDEFIIRAKDVHGDKYSYDNVEYSNYETDVIVTCNKHGDFNIKPSDLLSGRICEKCKEEEEYLKSIDFLKPELVKYLDNDEDRFLKIGSNKKINVTCSCGQKKSIIVQHLCRNGISCTRCGDRISRGERLICGVLEELNIPYIREFRVDLSDKKRYDFYLSNTNTIIEVHGAQHYSEQTGGMFGTLSEQKENDIIKKDNALKLGYGYIEINCSKMSSTEDFNNIFTQINIEFNKNKIIDSDLNNFIGIDNFNSFIYQNEDSSFVKIIDLYNQFSSEGYGIEKKNISKEIAKMVNLHKDTILRRLKQAADLHLIDYTPYSCKKQIKKIIKKDDGTFEEITYKSISECILEHNLTKRQIDYLLDVKNSKYIDKFYEANGYKFVRC